MCLSCILSKIRVEVFEKSSLFCIPNFGPKRPFFGPEGPILTQKLKNIVKLVVTTQNHAFQGKIWSLSDYVIFGVCRPPNPPQAPPDPPKGPGGPKMALMHIFQSNFDSQGKKKQKNRGEYFDLFFHSECTRYELKFFYPRYELNIFLIQGLT